MRPPIVLTKLTVQLESRNISQPYPNPVLDRVDRIAITTRILKRCHDRLIFSALIF
ncbi:hypothetical protein LBWT_X3850 (plasmid) [Leptolyngbya boryana IAM M-101]|nr:hypothetical protein LBWT_X3850 [Leptolyngbya boryana IAM M-101]BAS66661.1 hypothetical protein LBDG_X3850 [Leptolyngbya boryana dg5]